MITISPFHFFIFFDHRDAARSWNPRVSCLLAVVLVEVKMVLDMAHLSCLVVLMQLGTLLFHSNNHYNKSGSGSKDIGNNQRSFVGHLEQLGILGSTPWIDRTYPWKSDGSLRSRVETWLDFDSQGKFGDNNNNISKDANNLYWLRTGLFFAELYKAVNYIKTILNFIKKNTGKLTWHQELCLKSETGGEKFQVWKMERKAQMQKSMDDLPHVQRTCKVMWMPL